MKFSQKIEHVSCKTSATYALQFRKTNSQIFILYDKLDTQSTLWLVK
jgi:hypothetical protein